MPVPLPDLCPNGYMVMLQSLAEVYPSLCVNNPQRFHELIRSYQNRPAIATALVWALGQGGRKDLAIGLKGEGNSFLFLVFNFTGDIEKLLELRIRVIFSTTCTFALVILPPSCCPLPWRTC